MKKRNKILILMVISMVLGYLPWYNFSAVSSYIVEDLNLGAGSIGIILSIFQFGYVITVIITGWLADKIGKKNVVAWATLLTGIFSTLFVWLANGFYSILILRLLTGLSAGAIYAPGMALLSDWFPPEERGKAVGAYTGALTAAYAGGYFVAAPLASMYSWEMGVLATSIPVFIAAYIMFFLVEEKENGFQKIITEKQINKKTKPAPEGSYKGPTLAVTGYMGHMWELYAFWGWIGPFMVACSYAVGYSASEATVLGGQLAAFIILLGAPAVWVLGVIADKWGRIKTILLCSFASLIAEMFFGYLYGKSLTLVVIIGFWIGFWVVADSAIYKATLTEMITVDFTATALGFQSAAGYFMTILSPYAFGKILELTNSGVDKTIQMNNWGLPFVMLGLGALLAPLSAIILKKIPQSSLLVDGNK
ncbi:MAG: MFS transporter [Halothermotrichaceae bacterium]